VRGGKRRRSWLRLLADGGVETGSLGIEILGHRFDEQPVEAVVAIVDAAAFLQDLPSLIVIQVGADRPDVFDGPDDCNFLAGRQMVMEIEVDVEEFVPFEQGFEIDGAGDGGDRLAEFVSQEAL